jgi:hypothetical protein
MLWRDAVLAGRQELRSAFTFKDPPPGRLAKDAPNGKSPACLPLCAGRLANAQLNLCRRGRVAATFAGVG